MHPCDLIENKGGIPADAAIGDNLTSQIRQALATLTPREEKILRMRFGIGEKSDHTSKKWVMTSTSPESEFDKLKRRLVNYGIRPARKSFQALLSRLFLEL